jgi:hypothetical protein
MKTKDFLLLASGLALGYLVFGAKIFKSPLRRTVDGQVVEEEPQSLAEVVATKPSKCEKEWLEIASKTRFVSEEAREAAKLEFMSKCS